MIRETSGKLMGLVYEDDCISKVGRGKRERKGLHRGHRGRRVHREEKPKKKENITQRHRERRGKKKPREEGFLDYAARRAISRRGREGRAAPLGMTGYVI